MSDLPASQTAPTSPLVDLRYTATFAVEGECQVERDGSRWVLRPHAPHGEPPEGQCSCCADVELVLDVDVALSRVGEPVGGVGRWLVTRNDGADLGHLTDVPEPAPWMPVAQTQPPTLDDVAAVLTGVLGAVSRDCREPQWKRNDPLVYWFRDGLTAAAYDWLGTIVVTLDDNTPASEDDAWLVSRDGCPLDGEDAVSLSALPGLVRAAITRLGLSLSPTTPRLP